VHGSSDKMNGVVAVPAAAVVVLVVTARGYCYTSACSSVIRALQAVVVIASVE
jgi:hypothetical protein